MKYSKIGVIKSAKNMLFFCVFGLFEYTLSMIADRILDTLEKLWKSLRKWLSDSAFSDSSVRQLSKNVDTLLEKKLEEAKKSAEINTAEITEKTWSASTERKIPNPQPTTQLPPATKITSIDDKETVQPEMQEEKKELISPIPGKTVYHIKPFKDNDHGTAYWQSFLKSFMDISQTIQYVITGNKTNIVMYAVVPNDLVVYFENVFYASFPTSELIKDYTFVLPSAQYWVSYGKDDVLMADKDFMKEGAYLDPLKDLFGAFDTIDSATNFTFVCSYVFKKEKWFWENLVDFVNALRKGVTKSDDKAIEKKEEKPEDTLKCTLQLYIAYQAKDATMQQGVKLVAKGIFSKFLHKWWVKITPEKHTTEATLSQAVNFFHIPTSEYAVHALDYSVYRKLPAPISLPTTQKVERNALTLFGKTDYRWEEVRFGIKDEDSFRHLYIVWKTGTGKSTIMSNIIKSHMYTNKWLCLIDPHGDLVDTVLQHVPTWRTNDVILFDVSDSSNPIWFNLLQYNSEEEKNLVVSWVVSVFKKLFSNSWGPRLEYVLRNVMLSVVEYPNATIMHIMRVLTDKNFREEVLENVTDPIVVKFWRTEFDKRSDTQRNEAIAPITNKIGQFLSSSVVRNIFGQPSTKLNFRKVMDEGKILLINLSKWKIGEDNTEMIGSFIVTKLQIDAMSRTDIPERDRRPFYLHIDEFQNFATDAFAVILSEARKYRLALIVANQYTTQLNENIRDAIFGNVGSIVAFNVWYDDAIILSQQFKWLLTTNDLISIPKFRAYIRMTIDGIMSDPFSMSTLPLSQPEQSIEIKDKIRTQSRQRYAMDRDKLESLIKIWSTKTFSPIEKAVEKAMKQDAEATSQEGLIKTSAPVSKPIESQDKTGKWTVTESISEKWDDIEQPVSPVWIPTLEKKSFSLEDLRIGEWYDGIVKLKYNYGLFVIVKGIDGLLHKNFIKVPSSISWKDVYNIGDKIRVKAMEFKEVNGEKRIVWTQEQ